MIQVSQVYCHRATGYYVQKTQLVQTKRVSACYQFSAASVQYLTTCCRDVSSDCAVLSAFKRSGVAGRCDTTVEINRSADVCNSSDSLSFGCSQMVIC